MNYYNLIKNELINNEIYKKAKDYSKNKNDLKTYYNVGKILIDAQGGERRAKYGNGLIKEYSNRLTKELGKGYSIASLKNMRSFYLFCEKGYAMDSQLSWMHYRMLLPLTDFNEIKYYIELVNKYNIGYRELEQKIKNKEYERIPQNTKEKINNNIDNKIDDYIKNPILIKNKNNYEEISEKILQQMILEDIPSFLSELGSGYAFIKNEYKIKIGNTYNYIDLLLFNIEFNCYVVVELKVTDLKKEHIGQVEVYMNFIDKHLKSDNQNKTIGIILVRRDNKYIIEYSSDSRIISRTFELV